MSPQYVIRQTQDRVGGLKIKDDCYVLYTDELWDKLTKTAQSHAVHSVGDTHIYYRSETEGDRCNERDISFFKIKISESF